LGFWQAFEVTLLYHRLHRQRIAQGNFVDGTFGEVSQLDWVVWVAEKDLVFFDRPNDHEFLRREVFFGDAQNIVLGDSLDAGAVRFPVIRIFCVTSGEFILGQSAGDLRFGCECARKSGRRSRRVGCVFGSCSQEIETIAFDLLRAQESRHLQRGIWSTRFRAHSQTKAQIAGTLARMIHRRYAKKSGLLKTYRSPSRLSPRTMFCASPKNTSRLRNS